MPCTLVLGWLALATPADAGTAKLPDAETILDKYVEVTGGKAAYAKLDNCVAKKRIVHVGMGFEDAMTEYRARPNKLVANIESEALGKVHNGANGEISWYLSEGTGPLVEQGEARVANVDAAAFDQIVHWRKYYKKAECAGEEVVDGKACYKVVLTPNHGPEEIRWFDKKTSLVIKATKSRLSSYMPPMNAELAVGDYKWVDGILLPHRIERKFAMCGSTREMVFVTDSIKFNVDIPAGSFDLPAEITAAIKKGLPKVTGAPAPCGVPKKSATAKKSES